MEDYRGQNEVMTLTEVADYLQLAEKTVLRMARRGEIPAAKIASQWRFMRSVLGDWIAAQMQTLPSGNLLAAAGKNRPAASLRQIFRPELMNLQVRPGTKDAVIKQLIDPMSRCGYLSQADSFLETLIERERMMTTAIGHGIAVPHPRKPMPGMFPEPAVAVGLCKAGTNFDAIDDCLVHFFFVICATRESIHLQLMAEVAWLSRQEDILTTLRAGCSPQRAAQLCRQAADRLQGRTRQKEQTMPQNAPRPV